MTLFRNNKYLEYLLCTRVIMKFCLYLALFGGVYSSKMATAALEELTEKLVSCCSKVLLNYARASEGISCYYVRTCHFPK